MVEHELSPITAKDGTRLYTTTNHVETPIAGVIIIHGLGEHIGRYDHVYEALAEKQVVAYGMDLRGHGRSEGRRGHTPSYDLLMEDIEELMKTFRSDYNELPMFLFGHSMGGNLVVNYVIRKKTNELRGFVISSPWLKLAFDPPAWQVAAGNYMSKIFPGFSQENNLDPSGLSKISAVAEAYTKDPLVHSKITAGLYVNISKAGNFALANADKIEIPGYAYHGAKDPVTNYDATAALAASNTKMLWKGYENVYHEGHNDEEQEEIINDLISWLLKNL